jgi:hypothetical protein
MIDNYEIKVQPTTKVIVWQAYKKERQKKGSSGVDGMTLAIRESDLSGYLYKLWNRLSSGSYFPQSVREVLIPKKGGGIRPLGTPTLLGRIAQQVVKHYAEKPFERYADDIIVHCKTEKQANFMLRAIEQRMKSCKMALHLEKTKIINFRSWSEKYYARKYDFLGFSIRRVKRAVTGRWLLLPGTFVSQKSKKAIREKFRELEMHEQSGSIKELAQKLNPLIQGLINYYHRFWQAGMCDAWNGLNQRLLK